MRRSRLLISSLAVLGLALAACTTDAPTDDPVADDDQAAVAEEAGESGESDDAGTEEGEFFVRADSPRWRWSPKGTTASPGCR